MKHTLSSLAVAVLLLSVLFSCKKAAVDPPVQHACSNYTATEIYFDGEGLWFDDDLANLTFDSHYTLSWDESEFVMTTDIPVCHRYFKVLRGVHPELCPFEPYEATWTTLPSGASELRVKFPETISPCTMAYGQGQHLYGFKFRLYYQLEN